MRDCVKSLPNIQHDGCEADAGIQCIDDTLGVKQQILERESVSEKTKLQIRNGVFRQKGIHLIKNQPLKHLRNSGE